MPSLKEEIQQLQKVLNNVSTKLTEMQTAVEAAEQEKVVMKDKMVELEGKLAASQEKTAQAEQEKNAEIAELQEKLKAAEEDNIVSNKAIEELQIKLASTSENIADILTKEVVEEPGAVPVPKPRGSIDKSSETDNKEEITAVVKPKILTKKPSIKKQDSEGDKKDQSDEIMEGLKKNIDNITTPETSSETAVADTAIQVTARKSIVGGVQLPQLSNVVLKTTQKGQELFASHEQSSADVDDQVEVIGGEGQ